MGLRKSQEGLYEDVSRNGVDERRNSKLEKLIQNAANNVT